MTDAQSLHRKAMEFVDESEFSPNKEQKQESLLKALELETQAANTLKDRDDCEPTRSILYNSAAQIAVRANLLDEAKVLALSGLSGTPPEYIATQLEAILEDKTP